MEQAVPGIKQLSPGFARRSGFEFWSLFIVSRGCCNPGRLLPIAPEPGAYLRKHTFDGAPDFRQQPDSQYKEEQKQSDEE
jgi:hypothetical protein